MGRATWIAVVVAVLALSARRASADSAELDAAVALYDDLEYEAAVAALDAVAAQPGLARADLAKAHRYRLLSYVALGREDAARGAARDLLGVDRDYQLPRTESQRALDILSEVRASLPAPVLEVAEPVTMTQAATPAAPRRGTPVTIRVSVLDAGARHQRVLVRHRVRGEPAYSVVQGRRMGGGNWEVTVPGPFVRAPALQYYVVVQDAAGRSLAGEGSADDPIELALARKKGGGSVLGKWWFWAAVGGAAAIGTGAFIFLGGDGGGGATQDATVTVTVNLMP